MAFFTVETSVFRTKKRDAVRNGTAPSPPAEIAFGSGGHNGDRTARFPQASDTALVAERIRKTISKIYNENEFSFTAVGILEEYELIDYEISEAGLFDADGDLMMIMNFEPRTKKSGIQHIARFKINF